MSKTKHVCAGTAIRGMSVIELLMTITIISTLVVVAVPSFTKMVQDGRIRSQSSDLQANLAIARAEAAKRGVRVTFCTSTTYAAATPSCTAGGATAWNLGYILFADANGNGAFDSATDTLIAVAEPLAGGNALTSSNFTGAGSATTGFVATADTFQFRPSGSTDLPSGTTPPPAFKLCDSRIGLFGRQITVTVTGRFTSATVACP